MDADELFRNQELQMTDMTGYIALSCRATI